MTKDAERDDDSDGLVPATRRGVRGNGRFSRQIALFGALGQHRIQAALIIIVGLGGLGSHIAQQLAYLGVRRFILIDGDLVEDTNLNRLIGTTAADIGELKVAVAKRLILSIVPDADVATREHYLPYENLDDDLRKATVVVAGLDRETPRVRLLEACSDVGVPFVDTASEVLDTGADVVFGGRVAVSGLQAGCLSCRRLLDQDALGLEAMTDEQRRNYADIYGIDAAAIGNSGPSVVSINGVIASLAVTELTMLLTGMRAPHPLLKYVGHLSVIRGAGTGDLGCFYCARWVKITRPRDVVD